MRWSGSKSYEVCCFPTLPTPFFNVKTSQFGWEYQFFNWCKTLTITDKPMLFSCSLYETFLGNLVFNMILMINIVVALGYPSFGKMIIATITDTLSAPPLDILHWILITNEIN